MAIRAGDFDADLEMEDGRAKVHSPIPPLLPCLLGWSVPLPAPRKAWKPWLPLRRMGEQCRRECAWLPNQERGYVVGRHCAVRVQLYHALWHYKRRLRAKLKKALKQARAQLQVRGALRTTDRLKSCICAWSRIAFCSCCSDHQQLDCMQHSVAMCHPSSPMSTLRK